MRSIEETRILLDLIDLSFLRRTGVALPVPPGVPDRYDWLHREAPYSLLSHDTAADPVFTYVNEMALRSFGYGYSEMLSLPSRLSAGPADQAERNRLLAQVRQNGIAFNYEGLRRTKNGNTFQIYDGIIWVVEDQERKVIGQAALFWPTDVLRPDWWNIPGPK
ncbi:MEKHLA domain-containing protein [Sphingobacterium psychroaquaticum]|uniref:MEKHLA domain-containing protein n=1 Tax=Sphingobacterium psychroaquaticum TaxID=561061 RepID=UPI0010697BED|nr:MEKHLA domain-containing protein [Sphingobacterium psychroaquaticum]QBQ41334.1 MEKHLA domain-containing protein [Sphingobacterium psychroaquaticum]